MLLLQTFFLKWLNRLIKYLCNYRIYKHDNINFSIRNYDRNLLLLNLIFTTTKQTVGAFAPALEISLHYRLNEISKPPLFFSFAPNIKSKKKIDV